MTSSNSTYSSPSRTGKVLVVHQGALGDLLLALPAIRSVEGALGASLCLWGRGWVVQVLEGDPFIEELRDVDRGGFSQLFREGEGGFDLLDGAKQAFVFGREGVLAANLRGAGLEVVVLPPPGRKCHITDHYLSFLSSLGIVSKVSPPWIPISEGEKALARERLRREGIRGDLLLLHPGSGSPKKVWPPQKMARLAKTLMGKGLFPILIEGPADRAPCRELLSAMGGETFLLLRSPHLRELAAILSLASLYVGNDSGISHLAASVGAPTLVLFGPTDPHIWAPRGERVRWIWGRTPCAPCTPEQRRRCPRPQCMEQVDPEEALRIAESLLSRTSRHRF